MEVFLILFCASILSLIILIGRKMSLARNGHVDVPEHFDLYLNVPDFEELKILTLRKGRRYGYITLVILIRGYVLSTNFLQEKAKVVWHIVLQKISKHNHNPQHRENKFLARIAEYKNRIRNIKDRIKEEEGIE